MLRAARLIRILLFLQTRGAATAEQLADELEVSVRTAYRDLADLGAAGVPVYGERGEGGGYRLVGGYRTSLTGLTSDETGALLLSGAAAPVAGELGTGGLLATTRLKLLAAIPPGMRGVATRAEERFHLDPSGWAHARPRSTEHLQTVARAVWEDGVLRLRYVAEGRADVVRRTVHPLGLVHKTGTWYLVASHRHAARVYRVDRVRGAMQLDRPAQRPEGFDLPAFWSAWEQEYAGHLPGLAVDVRLGPDAQRHRDALGALAPREVAGEREEDDGWIRQTLVFDSPGVARAALLALAPDIEVLAPAEARADLRRVAHAVADRHRSVLRG
ncbi:MAG TPA: WYL domain-containing protein [Euzebyales bacterium]|nr:WYL domain-containing protein [Euzebyales bacterium]